MADQHTTRQEAGQDSRFLLTEERGWTTEEIEDQESKERQGPFVQSHKIERQIMYRRMGDLSLSRDQPLRLPCRLWIDNGDDELWIRPGEKETVYHQKRGEGYLIDYPTTNYNKCYTCMDHRKCDESLCMACRFTCYYCESEEGPLRVREKRLAKRVTELNRK